MKLVLHHFELPLRHEFRISRESISVQPTLIVELQADGYRGFGEATTNAYYGMTFVSMQQALSRVRGTIESYPADDPEGLWQTLAEPLRDNPFACSRLIRPPMICTVRSSGIPSINFGN